MAERPDVKVADLVLKACSFGCGKPQAYYAFDGNGDFESLKVASSFAKKRGYSCGELDSKNPIALAAEGWTVGKWHNISVKSYPRLKGIMVSDDFRSGPVVVVEYTR